MALLAAESSPCQNCSEVGPGTQSKTLFLGPPPSCSLFLKNLFLLPHIPGFLNPSHIHAAFSLTTRLSFFLLRICISGSSKGSQETRSLLIIVFIEASPKTNHGPRERRHRFRFSPPTHQFPHGTLSQSLSTLFLPEHSHLSTAFFSRVEKNTNQQPPSQQIRASIQTDPLTTANMADQLSGGMGNLSLDSAPPAAQLGGQQPTARSYIPPHMRGKMGGGPNGPPANGPMNGPPGPQPGPGPISGLNNSAWAG